MSAAIFAPSLTTKLVLTLVGTALAAVALASFLTDRFTTREFESYVMDQRMMEEHMGTSMPSAQGMMEGVATLGPREDEFVSNVRRSLWLSGGVTALAALGVGGLLARELGVPLRQLAGAAAEVAGGKLETRVSVKGRDEVAKLGHAFNRMAGALQQQERLRQSLITDLAHELRTPLSVLRGNIEAMQDGLLEPSAEQLEVLHAESVTLARLLEDLRTLSLASSGHLELRRQPVDLAELVRSSVAEMQAMAHQREIDLAVQAPDSLPPVLVDRDRIGQALRNLLENALQYTFKGGRVEVKVEAESSQVMVSVADTGRGMEPNDLLRVFDRFYRSDDSRSRATGGSGLGLAIVKQLVEAHGGRVWAESQLGQGSTFSFSVPV